MRFTFDHPHVFHPESDRRENARVLELNLEYLIAVNRLYRRFHSAPVLYQSGVRYERTVVWDSIPALYARQGGDCKSLTAALVAERRDKGLRVRPVFRWIKNEAGDSDYHILVMHENGTFEDPSKVCGMEHRDDVDPM